MSYAVTLPVVKRFFYKPTIKKTGTFVSFSIFFFERNFVHFLFEMFLIRKIKKSRFFQHYSWQKTVISPKIGNYFRISKKIFQFAAAEIKISHLSRSRKSTKPSSI